MGPDTDLVAEEWARIDAALALLPTDWMSKTELLARLRLGLARLWIGKVSAGVTEVTDGNMLHIVAAGGTLRGLLDMLPDVEVFAKACGCDGLEVSGRKGWARILPKHGFATDGERTVKVF